MTEILKVSSAITLGGNIIPANGKNLGEVSDSLGRNLRERGKCEVAAEEDIANGVIVAREFGEAVTPLVENVAELAAEDEAAPTDMLKRRRRAE